MMTTDEMKYTIQALSDRLFEDRFPHIMTVSDKERNNAKFTFAGTLSDFVSLIATSIVHYSQKYGVKEKDLIKAIAATLRRGQND